MTKIFDWLVIKPNVYYDSLKEPSRLLICIIPITILNVICHYTKNEHIFAISCCFVGLWRWWYFLKQ